MKVGKDMSKAEKIAFLSRCNLPVDPNIMTDDQLSGAVNMVLLARAMK